MEWGCRVPGSAFMTVGCAVLPLLGLYSLKAQPTCQQRLRQVLESCRGVEQGPQQVSWPMTCSRRCRQRLAAGFQLFIPGLCAVIVLWELLFIAQQSSGGLREQPQHALELAARGDGSGQGQGVDLGQLSQLLLLIHAIIGVWQAGPSKKRARRATSPRLYFLVVAPCLVGIVQPVQQSGTTPPIAMAADSEGWARGLVLSVSGVPHAERAAIHVLVERAGGR